MAERDQILDRPVFTVGERRLRWGDVVAAARIWSDWSEIERRARKAVELREAGGGEVPSSVVEEAQNRFRYERNLLAADDLEEWLGRWGVSVEQWVDQVRASVIREGYVGDRDGASDPGELEAAAWAEAVCSGDLEQFAERLATRCALADAAGELPDEGELTAKELERMDAVHARFCDLATTEEAIARRVQDEQLDWARVEARYLAHPDEDVVREAALGVREEGRDLEEMARAAGARYEPATRFYLADVEPELHAHLLAASAGELCGPLRSGDEHWLVEVGSRVPPSPEDPEIRARAAAKVVEGAVSKEVLRRVRWHDR